jgi:hypothetical protein
MAPRTIFLSRLIGLYFILAIPSLMIHCRTTVESAVALLRNEPLFLVVSLFTLIAGIAIVLAHNVWSGGAQAVLVTLVGWLTLIEALLFLLLPVGVKANYVAAAFSHPPFFYLSMTPALLTGIYLTWRGFKPRAIV